MSPVHTTEPSSSARLSQFGTTRTSFNGDLAHLLDLANYGGVAWINSLCGSTSSRMAYSGIDANYNNVPTYSWSVNVVCHEQGHNLGSRHTHACAWNGDNTAIDGCGPTAGYTEGSCPTAPVPSSSVGGTIMSYCHLLSAGIKFVNGFGPQPKAVILDRVNGASCLAACGSSCDPPNGLSVSSLFATTATLQWPSLGVVSYTLRWKPQASADWTTLTGLTTNSYALTGLNPTTAYEFQVLSVCNTGSSAYSSAYGFTTPAPCPDASEPNNTLGTAASITLPATVNALIASGSDQDHYAFTLSSAATLNISLSALPTNYNLALFTAGGTQVGSSTNGGTSSEFINYSAAAGSYVVRVVGSGGAFNTTQCYYLYVFSYQSQECGPVTGLNVSGLTYDAATLGWTAGLTIGSYDVRWKPVSASVWTMVSGLSVDQYAATALTPATDYHFSVKPNCAGSQTGFGEPFAFTTPAAPCEVSPPILISVKVILEGAYRSTAGLMVDSLRRQGVLPTGEPYTSIGLPVEGPTSTSTAVFTVTGNNAIVDWVLVELRTTNAPASVLERRAGLLQRDGDVVAMDGTSPLAFCSAAGSYQVSVRHRNHLACMTASAVALGPTVTAVDLTSASTTTYGSEARKAIGNLRALWAGNVVVDASLRYTGGSNDRDPVLQAVGNTTPNNTVTGYLVADVTLDGTVKYTGSDNDRDPILTNVGSTTPNNVRVEQLP
jgi:hypothetical protein